MRTPLARPDLGLAFCLLLALMLGPSAAGDEAHTVAGTSGSVSARTARSDMPPAGDRFPVSGLTLTIARRVADGHWGKPACRGQVAITWRTLAPGTNATASWHNPTDAWANPEENYDCTIALNPEAAFDAAKLCGVLMHEFGHLQGLQHSDDPGGLMSPVYSAAPAQCASVAGALGATTPEAAAWVRPVSRVSRALAHRCARGAGRGRATLRCSRPARRATRAARGRR